MPRRLRRRRAVGLEQALSPATLSGATAADPAPGGGSPLIEQLPQGDLLLPPAAGQHHRDRAAVAFGAGAAWSRSPAASAPALRPHPPTASPEPVAGPACAGGVLMGANDRGIHEQRHPRNAGSRPLGCAPRLAAAVLRAAAPVDRPGASGRTGSIPSRPGRRARADHATAHRCAKPTECRSQWCGAYWFGRLVRPARARPPERQPWLPAPPVLVPQIIPSHPAYFERPALSPAWGGRPSRTRRLML